MEKKITNGSLVQYKGQLALVLEVKPKGVLLLRVFRVARSNVDVEAGPGEWK